MSMLSQSQRTAILELHDQGVSTREIARVLNLSRLSVRKVLRSKSSAVPVLVRPEKAEAYRIQILELLASHKGNLVRVHEELVSRGAEVSYPALTAFCRRHGIGQEPKVAAGQYHFEPAEELQHDTSPHEAEIAGKKRHIQTASAVLCYSGMGFVQCYPTFQRFDCKVFLTEALRYFEGSTKRVMIDNTHVVVLHGTGAHMVPVPEMEAFAERFGFRFAAHQRGDANRSARVERRFHFIDHNFLAGRTFRSWDDLNQQARQWCDRVNSTYKKHIRAVPRELFAVERLHLKPLPAWIPDVYRLHERIVDVEGYVALHSSRYSVPVDWIGRRVEVRETKDKIDIQLDARHIVTHQRIPEGEYQRITLAEHRPPRGQGIKRTDPHPEEQAILQTAPELADYLAALKKRGHRYLTLALRQLLRIIREYPRQPVLSAVSEAARYGLYDLDRLERMVLRRIARDYFLLDEWKKGNPDEDQ
jgi:transposase